MSADLGALHEWVVDSVRRPLLVFLAAVAMVLLVACANLASLLVARAAGRQRELAIRAALGGAGWRLVRQLLTESALLAAAGGILGVFVARWSLATFVALSPEGLPRLSEVALDGRMLAFVAALTAVTALLFGLVPSLHGARVDAAWLRDGRRTVGAGTRTRRALVIGQVAVRWPSSPAPGCSFALRAAAGVSPGSIRSTPRRSGSPCRASRRHRREGGQLRRAARRLHALPSRSAGGSTVIGRRQGWTEPVHPVSPDMWGRELRHKEVTLAISLPWDCC
jgi:hypothetical protein